MVLVKKGSQPAGLFELAVDLLSVGSS